MARYVEYADHVIDSEDGAFIPKGAPSYRYNLYLAWCAEGNTPDVGVEPTIDPWLDIRAKRNQLLKDCDWTQLTDAPLTDDEKLAWRRYRDALRDVPQKFVNPSDVVWPTLK